MCDPMYMGESSNKCTLCDDAVNAATAFVRCVMMQSLKQTERAVCLNSELQRRKNVCTLIKANKMKSKTAIRA